MRKKKKANFTNKSSNGNGKNNKTKREKKYDTTNIYKIINIDASRQIKQEKMSEKRIEKLQLNKMRSRKKLGRKNVNETKIIIIIILQ